LRQTLGYGYLLTVALGAGEWRSNLSYDLPFIFNICDFVNLMTYDLHGGWVNKTGIHGALFGSALDPTNQNADFAVNFVLEKGVARDKLIMGIPAYGIGFRLVDANQNGVGSPTSSGGSYYSFHSLCRLVNAGTFSYRWDDDQKVPYIFNDIEWIGYDDVRSVTEKANYIRNKNIGGAMFWSIENDDHDNVCGYGRHPLISTAFRIIMERNIHKNN
jgi:chitinase